MNPSILSLNAELIIVLLASCYVLAEDWPIRFCSACCHCLNIFKFKDVSDVTLN